MAQTLTPRAFVDKWKQVSVKERSAYQEHFRDLCALVGHPTPTEGDPTGANYTFEAGAAKEGGGNGFADVWKRGFFAFEYKGKDGNLDRAYQQLQLYRESLQNPPLLIVSDLERIVIHSNFTNSLKKTVVLGFDDLLTPAGFDLLHAVFFEPERFRTAETVEQITADAAAKIGAVAERLRESGVDPQRAAHFLIRIVFCLFAEDVGLLPRDLLRQLLENTQRRPKVFHQVLRDLFDKMAHGGMLGRDLIPHFNGGLFDDADAIEIDSECIRLLFDVALQDWSGIEPSIFGTLFERSLNPSKRAQLGAHYTSRADILLIVEPVLMAPLRRRWEGVQAEVEGLLRGASTRRATALRTVRAKIQSVADELAAVRVLDPACGSGNFLYVALRQLLDMEKEVLAFASEKTGDPLAFPRVSPAQLFGIEKDEYAHELAQTTVWIGYIQWLRENGFGYPAEPILRKLDNIHRMDAVLHIDPLTGAASEPAWPPAEVIVGNPPFLGGNKIRQELGDRYVDELFLLYRGRVPAFADLVCYWFEKTRSLIEENITLRAGLIATQGIRGGVNRRVLERINESGSIFYAWSDRDWILDGATVHVSLVGFDGNSEVTRHLNGNSVGRINADLTSNTDLTIAEQLSENEGFCYMGPSAKAPFDIDAAVARSMLDAPRNVNGRMNVDVVRPVFSAIDIGQGYRGKWTIDFGLMDLDEAANYELPFEYVRKVVYPIRSNNRRESYARNWWQYAEARPGMRAALKNHERFIATPGVSKHRIFVWVSKETLCNQGTLVFARDDDYFFGVLHSQQHELWARRTGTQLREAESGFRYTPTSTFGTFPFPWPPGREPMRDARVQAIAAAARELVEKRDAWLHAAGLSDAEKKKRTLTGLYNARPTWLGLVHKKLDAAVAAAYGWPADLPDDDILARLLALNHERAGKG